MTPFFRSLVTAAQAGRPLCYAVIAETRGSTPQKAAARTLVFSDGTQLGSLGDGPLDRELIQQAILQLRQNAAALWEFDIRTEADSIEAKLGDGKLRILIDPLTSGEAADYYERALALTAAGEGGTEVIVVDATSSGLPEAAQFLLDGGGRLVASRRTHPRDAAPDLVMQGLQPIDRRPRPYHAAGLAYLPLLARRRLIIVGSGTLGEEVAELAAGVDFDVCLIDPTNTSTGSSEPSFAARKSPGSLEEALSGIEIRPADMCIIITRRHQLDEQALQLLINSPARYVGMIGSQRKVESVRHNLVERGVDPALLVRVRAPLGVGIGSRTDPEIAISIVAELIAVRNLGADWPPTRSPLDHDEGEASHAAATDYQQSAESEGDVVGRGLRLPSRRRAPVVRKHSTASMTAGFDSSSE